MQNQDTTLHLLNEVKNETPSNKNEWLSRNGILFGLRKVAPFALKDAVDRIKIPSPPVVHIEEKGRNEPNPNDPAYIEEVASLEYKRSMLGINAAVGLGTFIKDYGTWPERVEDDEWKQRIEELLELNIPERGAGRYMAWMKYSGAVNEQEIMELMSAVMKFSGFVMEEDVEQAADSFPDNEERDTAESISPQQEI